jgi:dihydroorotate dehydrogenase
VPDKAIINRMGFNNLGAQAIAAKLHEWRRRGLWPRHPVGINLGKSKITPLENAAEDYANSYRLLRPHLDFFVLNVSSPNTPGLRQLQDKAALDEILAAIQESGGETPTTKHQTPEKHQTPTTKFQERPRTEDGGHRAEDNRQEHAIRNTQYGTRPLLIKVAPDLSFDALDQLLELAGERQVAGIVATNTTVTRPKASDPALERIYGEAGGLSGRPLRARSTEIIRHLFRQSRGALPIVGVGGIFKAEDAWEKITAGASLVQLYTGLIYEGPAIARSIVSGLLEKLEAAGLQKLSQAVGISATRP